MDQFILFGDSITQQAFSPEGSPFGASLSDAYIRKLDIINRGLSGYNTRQALSLLPQLMPKPSQARVRLMWIFFGANDARLPDTPGGPQQHVPLEEFETNLRAIATHPAIWAHEGIRVILVTPPPVDERMLEVADEEKYGVRMVRRMAGVSASYAQAVVKLGEELNLTVLNIWNAMLRHHVSAAETVDKGEFLPGSKGADTDQQLQSYLRDGLHLSRTGYDLLHTELMKLIERTWPDQMPERLPFTFPAWDDQQFWGAEDSVSKI